MFLKCHRNGYADYTRTYVSWLDPFELRSSIFAGKFFVVASLSSVEKLTSHLDAFVADCNQTSKPFV